MNLINYVILLIITWNQMSAGVAQISSKLNDLSHSIKSQFENTSNSDAMASTGDWHNDFNNTDKFDCTSTIINRRNDVEQSKKIYQQSTEPERELKKSNEDYNNETHLLIRIFSIDYKVPVLKSDSEINPVITVILYCIVIVIGVTICIIMYRKYGFEKKEHRCTTNINKLTQKHVTNNAALDISRLKTATIKKCLLDDRSPSYGSCIV